MRTPLDRLRYLRDSLLRTSETDLSIAEKYNPQYVDGLRDGLKLAVKAIADEIEWAEEAERHEQRIKDIMEGKE